MTIHARTYRQRRQIGCVIRIGAVSASTHGNGLQHICENRPCDFARIVIVSMNEIKLGTIRASGEMQAECSPHGTTAAWRDGGIMLMSGTRQGGMVSKVAGAEHYSTSYSSIISSSSSAASSSHLRDSAR